MKAGFCAHVDATQNRLFYVFFFFRCYYQQQQTVLHLPLFYGRCAGHSCFVPYLVEVICMKIMNLKERKEDAVSPVIGVMLMLVVTIVIAAVVAAFAGGLATETESAPVAVLDADVYAGDAKLVLRSLSGDKLKLDETAVSIQSVKGEPVAKNKEALGSGYFTPGMTIPVPLEVTGELKAGQYVEVSVIVDGKHIVLNKEVLVKA